jgi:hypothetical protein
MEFQEHPKALYLRGNCRVAMDAAEEETARAEGYLDHVEDADRTEQELTGEPAPAAKKKAK